MKYLKSYKLLESVSDDLLEIKEHFQEIADEWDLTYKPFGEVIEMINNTRAYNVLTGGGYYTVAEGKDDTRHIVVYLPHKQFGKFYTAISIDMTKFNNDVDVFIDRIKNLGYNGSVMWGKRDVKSVLYIIDF
jgi:hypothetical protein